MAREVVTELRRDYAPLVAKFEEASFATYDRVLFEGLSLNIKKGDVVSLTGKSGAGKTVIIKILAGIDHQQGGSVNMAPLTRISYVPQELDDIEVAPGTSIRELFKDARGLTAIEERMHVLESELSSSSINSHEATLREYGELTERYQDLNGYDPEPEMQRVLSGLEVDEHSTGNVTLDTNLAEVSSGQLKRIMIARALYGKPDLMLLDDPTSHLDVAAVDWLASYLRESKSAIVIASNNQAFLDKCSTQTVGLTDSGRVFSFEGNYSDFITKRDAVMESEKAQAGSVANKLGDLRETDRMFRSKGVYRKSSDMAQVGRALATRMKKLEERYDEMPGAHEAYRDDHIREMVFSQERRSGRDVVSIRKVLKRYGSYTAVDLTKSDPINISQGEKWLVSGINGSGKSTLLRMIAQEALGGSFTSDEGEIAIGASVEGVYYAPDLVTVSKTGILIDEATSIMETRNQGRATAVLRFFGFSQTAIRNLDVGLLSSGERKRLALAKLMLKNPNLLILDEPTGDYMSEEIRKRLADSLSGYDGTLILVSHDVAFVKQLKIDRELKMPAGKVLIRD
jgi:ATP-binding cassette subfamily F protein 3